MRPQLRTSTSGWLSKLSSFGGVKSPPYGFAARIRQSESSRYAMQLRDKTAIVGIGATEFSKNSGRSELRLAVEAVLSALDDAGLTVGEVDGMCTVTMDNN